MNDFSAYLKKQSEYINNALAEYVKKSSFINRESEGLETMLEAMSYSLECGGKRIRPFIVLEFCRLFGGEFNRALAAACAVEMVHTYSLIHDDLPCMDDDDMRRGKPSNHIKFGYANALLAGDALLTLSFETILSDNNLSPEKRTRSALELAKAAGASGMIAGQVMDLANESRDVGVEEVRKTDSLKTGEMICVSGKIGCIIAGADKSKTESAVEYCKDIGLAFQVVDDILDAESTDDILGKPTGSDEKNNKSTYVSLLGLEKSRLLARSLTDSAIKSIENYENSDILVQLAEYLYSRIS